MPKLTSKHWLAKSATALVILCAAGHLFANTTANRPLVAKPIVPICGEPFWFCPTGERAAAAVAATPGQAPRADRVWRDASASSALMRARNGRSCK